MNDSGKQNPVADFPKPILRQIVQWMGQAGISSIAVNVSERSEASGSKVTLEYKGFQRTVVEDSADLTRPDNRRMVSV